MSAWRVGSCGFSPTQLHDELLELCLELLRKSQADAAKSMPGDARRLAAEPGPHGSPAAGSDTSLDRLLRARLGPEAPRLLESEEHGRFLIAALNEIASLLASFERRGNG